MSSRSSDGKCTRCGLAIGSHAKLVVRGESVHLRELDCIRLLREALERAQERGKGLTMGDLMVEEAFLDSTQ